MDSRFIPSRYNEDNKDINTGFLSKECLFTSEVVGGTSDSIGNFRNLKENHLWIWGRLRCGIGGNGVESECTLTPRAVRSCGLQWRDIHLGQSYYELCCSGVGCYPEMVSALAITSGGDLYVWGSSPCYGQGDGSTLYVATSQTTPYLSEGAIPMDGIGKGHSWRHYSAFTDSQMMFFGKNTRFESGRSATTGSNTDHCNLVSSAAICQNCDIYKIQINDRLSDINCVPRGLALIRSQPAGFTNHQLVAWSCCNGDTSRVMAVVCIPTTSTGCNLILDFDSARTGYLYTIGAVCSGTLRTLRFTGYNVCGIAGTGTTPANTYVDAQTVLLPAVNSANTTEPVKKFTMGSKSAFAIMYDGSLWGWGDNTFGQLGNGQSLNVISCPIQIGSDYNWRCITTSAEGDVVAAIKTDGSLWVWGRVSHIEGNGVVTSDRCVPTRAACSMANNWVRISVVDGVIAGITEETLI